MRSVDVLKGALAGAVVGVAIALILISLTLFSAVRRAADASITGLVDVEYVAGPSGGFDISLSTGPGTLVFLLVGALLGAAAVYGRHTSQKRAASC